MVNLMSKVCLLYGYLKAAVAAFFFCNSCVFFVASCVIVVGLCV